MIGESARESRRAGMLGLLVVFGTVALLVSPLGAQSTPTPPKVFNACYNKGTGTVYRIKEPNLPPACTSSQHVEFSWTDGIAGNDHGALTGLLDDDHPQYLRTDGTRALSGNLGIGGFKLTNLGAATANGDALRFEQGVKIGDAAGGDLGGTFPDPSVLKVQGRAVSSAGPTAGQVLTWNDGTSAWEPATPASGGVTDHGALTGLTDDDHPQYLLTNGARATTNGFAMTGAIGVGSIPATGAGSRLMWYPKKAAFRAGNVVSEWDDANIGESSTALGSRAKASGLSSFATGDFSTASGSSSAAIGQGTIASGNNSTAIGSGATASGPLSTAIGSFVTASGDNSMVLGSLASSNNQPGSFVIGAGAGATVTSTAPNQLVVRAAGGTIFYSNGPLTAGVSLAAGAGSWASVSDVRRKENFRDLDAETVLAKLARMAVKEWNYKSQDSAVRHVGPTAQDFYAAFKLAANDTTITTTDIDGIALLAIQALERRTNELREKTARVSTLEARVAELERRLAPLLDHPAVGRPVPDKR